jgi:hypothetical protein
MGGFQKLILIIALIVLLISLLFIGISIHYSRNKTWPPSIPSCPDYWISEGTDKDAKCINVQNLGVCKAKTMNFNNAPYVGSNGNCAKYTWANNCNIAWDGLTYGTSNPCV